MKEDTVDIEGESLVVESNDHFRSKTNRMQMILLAVSATSLVLVLTFVHEAYTKSNKINSLYTDNVSGEVSLKCPYSIDRSENDKNENFEWYDEKKLSEEVLSDVDDLEVDSDNPKSVYPTNMTEEQIVELKNSFYDGSGWTYYEFKDVMFDWKSRYGKVLEPGSTVFESACGIGMNLLMTADVLAESSNITDLKLYGIEYRPTSTADANNLLGQLLSDTGNATLGDPICRGDATDLFFVPSSSFDLAFTGYIDPIQDPLNLQDELGRDVKWSDFCDLQGQPTENGKLSQVAVEEWFAKWVTELIRITKPGGAVAIEQVSLPTCDDKYDWGGVSKGWWNHAVIKYGWDINMFSFAMEDVYPDMKNKRYNVYMEKKKVLMQ